MKKSLLIILCTLMSLMSWAQNRADGTAEPYAVLNADNTVLTFYYDDQKAARNGMSVGPFTSPSDCPWYSQSGNITTVVLDSSFANCTSLTSTAYWFRGMSALTTIEGITNLQTDNVTDMSRMFQNCSGLMSLDLSHFNTANVTSMEGMFSGCSGLTSLDLSHFNTANVTDMSSMFQNCSGLASLDLSHFNTANVTDMHDIFRGCSGLTSLDMRNFNTANVTTMNSMFRSCSNLTSLDLSSFNTVNVTIMEDMFSGCTTLTTIYCGDGWSTTAVTDGTGVFSGCIALVGGAGTVYDENHIDYTYAHIDGGENNPGYFTAKNATGTFDIRVSVYGNGEVSVGNLPDVIVDGKSAVASVDAGGSLEMFFFPLDGYQIGSVVLDNNDVTAFVTPATEYSAASYILNDINASHDITVTFTAKEGSGVVAPEFRFEGDNLTMSTETQNASIFYKMEDLASMVEAYVDSVTNSLVVTADAIHSTYYEQPFELKKNAVVKAIAVMDGPSGMVVSDTTTMVYDYEAWVNLREAVMKGVDLYDRAKGNPNVDAQLLEDLQWALNEGDMIYNQRAQMDSFEATHFTQRINELCAQIEAQMGGQKVATPTLKWENDNLTIETETQDADIFYWLSDTDVNGDGILDNGDYAKYSSALTIQRDVTIRAYAAKQGMNNSDTIQVVYPYTAWERLLDIIGVSKSIVDQAYQNPKVPQDLVAELENGIMKGLDMYEVRTAEEAEINDMADRIRYMAYEIERMMQIEAQFEHGVLSVYGSTTMAEAVQEFGINNINETIAAIKWNSSSPLTNDDLRDITNPNLLIYVEAASLAPANRDNVVINGFAKNVVLSDVTSGNNNFYCPEEFTAEAISYTRNFQQQTEIGISRGWESIALPFDVQTIMHEKNGVLSPFGSSEGGKPFWLRQLSDNGLVQAIEIHANRPYLISMPNCTEYPAEFNQPGRVTFSSLNVRVPVTEEETVAMADSTIVLIPTFQRMEQSDWIYALNVGETRAQYPEGSVFEQGLRAVRPFEAFTVHNNNQSNPAPRYIAINEIGNGTTGIENIVIKDVNALGDRWYSLDGRLLQGKPAQKGIYIHNGKKKIIK